MDITIPPELWEGDAEGVLTAWLFDDGATVKKGDLLVEVMTEKVQYEITAPEGGVLRIRTEVDDVVTKGAVIGTIDAA